jgi:hypothetical protein
MSCILRVFGSSLNVDALLAQSALKPDRVWKKGEPRFKTKPNDKALVCSGASFVASEAGLSDFDAQAEEAGIFLERNFEEIRKIVGFPDVEGAVLDFGIKLRDVAVHCDYLSPKLIQLAARAGIGIELSHYPCSEEPEG